MEVKQRSRAQSKPERDEEARKRQGRRSPEHPWSVQKLTSATITSLAILSPRFCQHEQDLYEVLGISRSASKIDIKKAYHQAARSHHPDKVPESERTEAEVRFKAAKSAYDILYDDDKRHLYDRQGMSAFSGGGAASYEDFMSATDWMRGEGGAFADLFEEVFGRNGHDAYDESEDDDSHVFGHTRLDYQISLEELYKGKTTKFANTRTVQCQKCDGTGAKAKAKLQKCNTCNGKGKQDRQIRMGIMALSETVKCATCSGSGKTYRPKDQCRVCKGTRQVETRKMVELHIPAGARHHERIVLEGQGDQLPGQAMPSDVIFRLVQKPHHTFHRDGADLRAKVNIWLSEALVGFDRVVLTHLDGRGLHLCVQQPCGKAMWPGQTLRIAGEGMPERKGAGRGDLYLTVQIAFPEDGWLQDEAAVQRVRDALPTPGPIVGDTVPDVVEKVEVEVGVNPDEFGDGDLREESEWIDADSDEDDF